MHFEPFFPQNLFSQAVTKEIVVTWQTLIFTCPTILSFALFFILFHTVALTFEIFDRLQVLHSYKIFHATQTTPSYRKMLPQVVFNQLFVMFPTMLLWTRLGLTYNKSRDAPPGIIPQVLSYLSCATLAPFIHEVLFYVPHRFLLHSHWGFKHLNHALHHSSRAHSAISAMYMAPIDFFLECVLPYVVPLTTLTRMSILPRTHAVLMLPIGALGGLYEHSGYNFIPMIDSLDTRTHGLHHANYNCSFADGFGSTNILDPFLGTACNNMVPAATLRTVWTCLKAYLKPTTTPVAKSH